MTYGHAYLLNDPRCVCGKPVQVVEDDRATCAACALVLEQKPPR